eukprot:TRINITY_DN6973_c0_g1_i1.p1 TRINITY_DN6973_c0_g1~~TRINITY_DN6973_c0_g1_i1.p1  ORF type:complete len:778 (-),score=123.30 TRINITY_DN6973_c0_g1_i1:132-2402(-)
MNVSQRAYAVRYGTKPPQQNQHAGGNTFVSGYFEFDPETIQNYLTRKNFKFVLNPGSHELCVQTCPFCHDTKGKADNLHKLYIHSTRGTYKCHRCGTQGSWFDFQKRLGDLMPISNFNASMGGAKSTSAFVEDGRGDDNLFDEVDGDIFDAPPSRLTAKPKTVETASGVKIEQMKPRASGAVEQWKLQKTVENLDQYSKVLDYLTKERGLTRETIDAYKVGAGTFRFLDETTQKWVDHQCVTFPWINRVPKPKKGSKKEETSTDAKPDEATTPGEKIAEEEATDKQAETTDKKKVAKKSEEEYDLVLARMKYRPVVQKTFRLDPTGGAWGLFGWHLVPPGATEIVLTEGEFDAMSVYQATGVPAVSLPNGCNSLPIEIIEMLEPFKRIVLWMDDDVKGQEGVEKFSMKLGMARCVVVQMAKDKTKVKNGTDTTVKDANDALKLGLDLKGMLSRASGIPHKQILTFDEVREQVFLELSNPQQVAGVQCSSFPTLNTLIKGHRRGELTIVTGPTGIGKTSILSQLSIDYCKQGVNTLWGSFELQNVKLIKKMLIQYAAKNLEKNIHEFKYFADKFSELPLYFMKFYGTTQIDNVLDAMEYAVYAYDVEHIILDNLQFMTGSNARGYEKFDILDNAIERFRKFATNKNVHITLVIHPRKEQEGMALSAQSVFGSAKATQEADNVLIIQKPFSGEYRYLEVVKNRFSGELGKIPYRFDADILKYYELTKREVEMATKNAKSESNHSNTNSSFRARRVSHE